MRRSPSWRAGCGEAADRRRVHRGSRTPTSVAAATGALPIDGVAAADGRRLAGAGGHAGARPVSGRRSSRALIVREKEHPAKPMTIDQALFEMELVGHDFYLFADADSGQPSVVYRRKGYDYGVIRLIS